MFSALAAKCTSFEAAIGLFEQYLIAGAILIDQDIKLVWVKNSSQ